MANGVRTTVSNPDNLADARKHARQLHSLPSSSKQPPLNFRDASNPQNTRQFDKIDVDKLQPEKPWKQPPTPISIPNNARPPQPKTLAGNPFSNRLTNNLHGNKKPETAVVLGHGNMSRKSILSTGLDDSKPNKRQKKEHQGKQFVQSKHFAGSAEAGPSRPPTSVEVIAVDDEDEILSHVSSDDPIDGFKPERTAIPDGPGTAKMRQKLERKAKEGASGKGKGRASDDDIQEVPGPKPGSLVAGGQLADDPIEDADGFDNPNPEFPKPGTVKQRVKEINFLAVESKDGRSTKAKMRTKNGLTIQDVKATAPSGYMSGSKLPKESKSIPDKVSLPLEACIVGTELLESSSRSQYWLHFEYKSTMLTVTMGSNDTRKQLPLDQLDPKIHYTHVSEVKVDEKPIAAMAMWANNVKGKWNTPTFKAGSKDRRGTLYFKFSMDEANWDKSYSGFVAALQKAGCDKMTPIQINNMRNVWTRWRMEVDSMPGQLVSASASRSAPSHHSTDDDTQSVSSTTITRPAAKASRKSDLQSTATARETRSSARIRQSDSRATSERSSPPQDPDELMLVYPFSGPGAVNVTRGDLKRLEPHQYLNDTLIEYGLKLWLADLRDNNPELADQVHIYSSFFYKKISVKNKEQGYQSVRKWTSKIDIFSKKYLIVPINENLHWYLAIICYPEHVLKPPPPESAAPIVKPMTRKRKRETEVFEAEASLTADDLAADADAASVKASSSKPTSSAHSSTVSAPPSISASVSVSASASAAVSASASRERSPMNEVIPDSQDDGDTVSTQRSDEGKGMDEHEVETMLQHQCSISDPQDKPSDNGKPNDEDVVMTDLPPMVQRRLQYPKFDTENGTDDDAMDVDKEEKTQEQEQEVTQRPVQVVEQVVENEQNTSKQDPDQKEPSEPPIAPALDLLEGGVPAARFYSTAGARHKGKEREQPEQLLEQPSEALVAVEPPEEDEIIAEPIDPTVERAYIFTFDSLGTKHPKACAVLSDYLAMEAKDKKGVEQSSSPFPKTALVPFQPNYCDCGVYVLHFVKKFMEDPHKFIHLILTKTPKTYPATTRGEDWEHSIVGTMRDTFMNRSLALAKDWKGKKEAEKKEAAERTAAEGTSATASALAAEDSDDDVIVAEPPSEPVSAVPRPKPRLKGKNAPKMFETKIVARLR